MTISVAELREEYQKAVDNAHKVSSLWSSLKNYKGNHGTILAYKASVLALKAKHDWNPLNKLNLFNESMNIFQEAVRADEDNIEIRFLRFAILHNTPEFLQQDRQLKKDVAVFLKNVEKYKDFDLHISQLTPFYDFFLKSKRLSPEELAYIKNIIHYNH